jgi:hypothetical protein
VELLLPPLLPLLLLLLLPTWPVQLLGSPLQCSFASLQKPVQRQKQQQRVSAAMCCSQPT